MKAFGEWWDGPPKLSPSTQPCLVPTLPWGPKTAGPSWHTHPCLFAPAPVLRSCSCNLKASASGHPVTQSSLPFRSRCPNHISLPLYAISQYLPRPPHPFVHSTSHLIFCSWDSHHTSIWPSYVPFFPSAAYPPSSPASFQYYIAALAIAALAAHRPCKLCLFIFAKICMSCNNPSIGSPCADL